MQVTPRLDDLKHQVATALEKQGVMAKIRAQLRAHVFKAIEEHSSTASRAAEINEASRRVSALGAASGPSLLALDLIREWLDFYELDYTASTLAAEGKLQQQQPPRDRQALLGALQIGHASTERPVLVDLLMQASGQQLPSPTHSNPSPTSFSHQPQHSSSSSAQPSPRSQLQPQQFSRAPMWPSDDGPPPSLPRGNVIDVNKSGEYEEAEVSPSSLSSASRLGVSRRSTEHLHGHGGSSNDRDQPSSSFHHDASPSQGQFTTSANTTSSSSTLNLSFEPPSPRDGAHSPSSEGAPDRGGGGSARRRRDRNLDMAAVHTLVSPTNASAAAAAASPSAAAVTPTISSASSYSTFPSLSGMPASLATNRSAHHPAPDVPHIDLAEGSDLEASGTSFSGDPAATSMDLDKQRLEVVNRMIASYEAQTPKIGAGASVSASADLDDGGDSYEDEEFIASDVGGDGGIEESIEVEEELETGAESKVDDSLDADYFNSSSSAMDHKPPAAQAQRRTHLPALAAESSESIEYNDSYASAGHSQDQQDADLSDDASVHDPLEANFPYTEDAEAV